jgi:hypothetical protein
MADGSRLLEAQMEGSEPFKIKINNTEKGLA